MNMLNDNAIRIRITTSMTSLESCPLIASSILQRYSEVVSHLHKYSHRTYVFLFACALYDFSNAATCLDIAENNIRRLRSHLLLTPSADQDCVDLMAMHHAACSCQKSKDDLASSHLALEYRLRMLESL